MSEYCALCQSALLCFLRITGIILFFTLAVFFRYFQSKVSPVPSVLDFRQCFILLTNEKPTWCHFLFYFTYYVLNMFRTLVYPSSEACDCVDEIPHRSSCSQFVVCWSFCCGWYLVVFVLQAEACKTNTTSLHQHSRKLLKMDILMSETCWAHNKWNKIANDIKLVFHSSTIAMMHGPINIKCFIRSRL